MFAGALMSARTESDYRRLDAIETKSLRFGVQGIVAAGRAEQHENRLSRLYQHAAYPHGRGRKAPGVLYRGVVATDFPNEGIHLGWVST